MKRFSLHVLLIALSMSMTACDLPAEAKKYLSLETKAAQETSEVQEKAPSPEELKTPRIIVKGIDITYNGKPLKFGTPLEDWVKVIGEEPRFRKIEFGSPICVWDNLGLVATIDNKSKGNLVESLEIVFTHLPMNKWNPSPARVPGQAYIPLLLFPGYLELNTVPIFSHSTVREINKGFMGDDGFLKKGVSVFHCPLSGIICYGSSKDRDQIMSIKTRRDDSIIYNISFDYVKMK